MKTKRTFYRVIPNPSFSQIYAETLEEARVKKQEFGKCENGTPANKKYWKDQSEACKIVKVTEIIEVIE